MQRLVAILLALLIPVLAGGLSDRRLAAVAAPASSSQDDADGDRAPEGNPAPAGAQDLTLCAAPAPVGSLAATPLSFRLRIAAARAPRPTAIRSRARPSKSAGLLRC